MFKVGLGMILLVGLSTPVLADSTVKCAIGYVNEKANPFEEGLGTAFAFDALALESNTDSDSDQVYLKFSKNILIEAKIGQASFEKKSATFEQKRDADNRDVQEIVVTPKSSDEKFKIRYNSFAEIGSVFLKEGNSPYRVMLKFACP